MPYELFISVRYLRAKRKQAFISLISVISIGGVAIGVAALIIVLAVMTGFKDDIRDKILGIMPHILIQRSDSQNMDPSEVEDMLYRLGDIAEIVTTSPYVAGQLLISSDDNVSGVNVHGIDPTKKQAVPTLEQNLRDGDVDLLQNRYENLENPTGPKRDGMILGGELARLLGVFPGEDVTLISPTGHLLPTGLAPKLKKFRIVGIFNSGFYEYDAGLAYISLTAAQKFFSIGNRFSGIEVRVKDVYTSKTIAKKLTTRLAADYVVQDWGDMNKSLFSAINLEKLAMFLILALIILVAAFNIISTLVMMVMEKHADIATLKSMGATSNSIMKIFMFEGSVIGILGTGTGTLLGVVFCWVADTFELIRLDGGSYFLQHLPFTVNGVDLVLVIIASLLICFASTIYPARQASKLDPVAVFRYE
jgi:lipoprotein-releasing system permease protein